MLGSAVLPTVARRVSIQEVVTRLGTTLLPSSPVIQSLLDDQKHNDLLDR